MPQESGKVLQKEGGTGFVRVRVKKSLRTEEDHAFDLVFAEDPDLTFRGLRQRVKDDYFSGHEDLQAAEIQLIWQICIDARRDEQKVANASPGCNGGLPEIVATVPMHIMNGPQPPDHALYLEGAGPVDEALLDEMTVKQQDLRAPDEALLDETTVRQQEESQGEPGPASARRR